jgi:hypothetical protein
VLTAAHTAANIPRDHRIRIAGHATGHRPPGPLLLGRDDFGNGHDGVVGVDHRLRRVTNRVDSADEYRLRFRFDPPPGGTALEGVAGEGDSGGPAPGTG